MEATKCHTKICFLFFEHIFFTNIDFHLNLSDIASTTKFQSFFALFGINLHLIFDDFTKKKLKNKNF